MGILGRLLGSKKKMNENAIVGIDKVKVGLMHYLLPECEIKFGPDYAAPLAAAVVNTVFAETPSNETGRLFIEKKENLQNVRYIIEKVINPQEKLKQIITDAVRVKCTLQHAMNNNLSEQEFRRLCQDPIENLKLLGLFVPGGELPDISIFLHNAEGFVQACKADFDLHLSRGKHM